MLYRRLVSLILAAWAALALGAGARDAEAAKAKKKKRGKTAAAQTQKAAPKADAAAVAAFMGPFKWGMSPDEVIGILAKQIEERYAEEIKATRDVYRQDQLRKKMKAEVARLRKNFYKFEGKRLEWDVSLVGLEYGHKNDESMLVYWENDPETKKDQRRFFFFVDDKLWKQFIAFNAEQYEGLDFQTFKGRMEERFGPGQADVTKEGVKFVYWRSGGVYLRALDMTATYGNFCLALSDDKVEEMIYARRQERNPATAQENNIVNAIKENSESDSKPPLEENSNVIDRITGSGGR